jgi:hypothetical protein
MVSGSGVRLIVPEGAVTNDVTISVASSDVAPPDGYIAVSPIYTFSPDGLVFTKPVVVEITLGDDGLGSNIVWSSGSGVEDLPSTISGTFMTANVMHFSRGFIGHRTHGQPIDDAGGDDASISDGPSDSSDGSTCHAGGGSCDAGTQCCSGVCSTGGTCTAACKGTAVACDAGTQCCSGVCGAGMCTAAAGN